MSSREVDEGTLKWVLSRRDLTLIWDFSKSACGKQLLAKAPVEASFIWMRGEECVWSLSLSKAQLEQLTCSLESKDIDVPSAFVEALRDFPSS